MPDTLKQAHVITLQNGLGNGERVAKLVGIQRTLEGVSMIPAEFIGPGEVASSGAAQTWLYHASGQTTKTAEHVGADFNEAG